MAIARALINNPPLLFADEPTGNLDSKTSKEILQMFQQLNAEEGITIILVTHDAGVADYAKRIIRISDGLIEDGAYDRPRARRPRVRAAASRVEARQPPDGGHGAWSDSATRGRRLMHVPLPHPACSALKALRRNVMRSALTTLGIVIGVAAVIAMWRSARAPRPPCRRPSPAWAPTTCWCMPGTAPAAASASAAAASSP